MRGSRTLSGYKSVRTRGVISTETSGGEAGSTHSHVMVSSTAPSAHRTPLMSRLGSVNSSQVMCSSCCSSVKLHLALRARAVTIAPLGRDATQREEEEKSEKESAKHEGDLVMTQRQALEKGFREKNQKRKHSTNKGRAWERAQMSSPRATLAGTWKLDSSRSDDIGDILKLLGVGWARRRSREAATITLIEHTDEWFAW